MRLRGEVQSTLVAGAEVYTREGGFIGQPRGELIVNKEGLKALLVSTGGGSSSSTKRG